MIRIVFTRFLFLISFFALNLDVQAQELEVDSLENISKQSNELLRMAEQQRTDSIKRVGLENRFLDQSVKNTKEYQDLYREINVLKNKDSLLRVRRIQKVDSLKQLNRGMEVKPFDTTLFNIYTNVGSYSASYRANVITQRITALTEDHKFSPDSLSLIEDENGYTIVWRDQMIMAINDNDAVWMNTDKKSLAEEYLQIIKNSISDYREANSLKKMLISVSLALLILIFLGVLVFGINKAFKLLKTKITDNNLSRLAGISFKNYELISKEQIRGALLTVSVFVKWITILIVMYLALPLLFNLFPETEGYAAILIDYFVRPLRKIGRAVLDSIPNVITIGIILVIFKYALRMLAYFANEIRRGRLAINGFYREWAIPTYQILKVVLMAFMLIIIFPYLPGSDSTVFKGVSVFIGVLFSFGSSGAVSNIVAGLVLTYMRAFSIGDRIKIGDVVGDVIEKSLLVTRVRTNKNEVISIPNSSVMNSHTINYSIDQLGNGLIIHAEIAIGFDIPWQKVHELGIIAASNVEFIEKEPSPFVLQISINEFDVTYQINAYTKKANKYASIYSELNKQILEVFQAAGVELVTVHFMATRDGSEKQLPNKE